MARRFKKRYIPLILLALIPIIYFAGPRPQYETITPDISPLNLSIDQLDYYLKEKESKIENLKLDNEARIVWADSIRKTPYSIVYIHGFSASAMEGDPLHFEIAQRYGMNLFFARLADHGIDDIETFDDIQPSEWMDSAKEAIAIGNLIGEKVIVMSCSTGGTLSAYLAAHHPDKIAAQLMYSPNFRLYDPNSTLMTGPWGREIIHQMVGDYRTVGFPDNCKPFWTDKYRTEGVIALQGLIDQTMMDETFEKIQQPTFLGYYYKTEEESDHVISIDRIREVYELMSSPNKKQVAFPNVDSHVICSKLQSKDVESVRRETFTFIEENLGISAEIE